MAATNVVSNPFPLGIVVAGSNFATASVAITNNFTDLAALGYGFADAIYFRALPGNTANIYICNSAVNPDKTNYLNVFDVLAKGVASVISSSAMDTLQLSQWWIGADNANDGAIVSVKFR